MAIYVEIGKEEAQVFCFNDGEEEQVLNLIGYFLKNRLYANCTKYSENSQIEEERILIRYINNATLC